MKKLSIALIMLLSLNSQAKLSDEEICERLFDTIEASVNLLKTNPELKFREFKEIKSVTAYLKLLPTKEKSKHAAAIFSIAKKTISNENEIDYEAYKARCVIKFAE